MSLKTPILAVNFKTYKNATAAGAAKLAKIIAESAKKNKVNVAVCVQASDVYRISQAVNIPVLGQHVDAVDYGAHTGHILAHDVAENGAVGTLLNHSEDQYGDQTLSDAIGYCKKAKLFTIVCASSIERATVIARLGPDCIAYEPAELIGGDVSVTTRPEVIEKLVFELRRINPKIKILVGAGVKNAEDVKVALRLKTDGVLLASAIAASEEPKKALLDLMRGFNPRAK